MIFVITKILGSYGINLTLGDCVRIVDATPTVFYHFLIYLFIYLWGVLQFMTHGGINVYRVQ